MATRGRSFPAISCVIAALSITGCGTNGDGADPRPGPRLAVDERGGTVEGVGLGDRDAEIEHAFGHGASFRAEPRGTIYPLDLSPGDATSPAPLLQRSGRINALRYRGMSFVSVAGKVVDTIVTSEQATTRRGLHPGHSIEQAEELYPELECGETDVGGDYPIFEPACWGRLGDTYIWIGGDPINHIHLSTRPLRASP